MATASKAPTTTGTPASPYSAAQIALLQQLAIAGGLANPRTGIPVLGTCYWESMALGTNHCHQVKTIVMMTVIEVLAVVVPVITGEGAVKGAEILNTRWPARWSGPPFRGSGPPRGHGHGRHGGWSSNPDEDDCDCGHRSQWRRINPPHGPKRPPRLDLSADEFGPETQPAYASKAEEQSPPLTQKPPPSTIQQTSPVASYNCITASTTATAKRTMVFLSTHGSGHSSVQGK
jgi:hypothetical protein